MVTVRNIYPSNYQEDVPIDISIEIEFDKELADSVLTSDYFRVFVMPNYTGSITCTLAKDSSNQKKVLLTPINNLPINTLLEVWIAGDMDLTDGTQQGIKSETGESMEGNYTLRFTTGTQSEIDIEEDGGTLPDGSDTSDTTTYNVSVTKTNPENNAYSVDCAYFTDASGVVDVYFDYPVLIHTGSGEVKLTTQPLDDIDSYIPPGSIHGYELDDSDLTIDYHPNHTDDKQVIRMIMDESFRCNSDIFVKLLEDFVTVSGTTYTLASDYEFEFRTVLHPMLTTARAVKSMLLHSISGLSDKIIDEYILTSSLDVLHTYFNGTLTSAIATNRWVRRLVTCLSAKNIAMSVLGGYIGVLERRTLGDLTVQYDSGKIKDALSSVEECIFRAEAEVEGGNSDHGVKSENTTKYPGRRRDVWDL